MFWGYQAFGVLKGIGVSYRWVFRSDCKVFGSGWCFDPVLGFELVVWLRCFIWCDVRCLLYLTLLYIIFYTILYYYIIIIIYYILYILYYTLLFCSSSSHLPNIPLPLPFYSPPLIHSIRVGTYLYLFIFSSDLSNIPNQQSDPACFIGVDGWGV